MPLGPRSSALLSRPVRQDLLTSGMRLQAAVRLPGPDHIPTQRIPVPGSRGAYLTLSARGAPSPDTSRGGSGS